MSEPAVTNKMDKTALLKQLTINPEEENLSGVSPLQLVLACLISVCVSVSTSIYWYSQNAESTNASTEHPQQTKKPSPSVLQSSKNTSNSTGKDTNDNSTTETRLANYSEVLNASGYITARRIATVSAEIMGLINKVTVEEGMTVEQGQVLAQLDDAIADVNLRLAQAQYHAAQVRLDSIATDISEARRVLTRINELKGNNYSSEADRTRAQTDLANFENAYASAKAELAVEVLRVRQQQEQLDNHTIRAPFAGVVTVKNAQPGEIVAPSSAGGGFTRTGICTIVDMGSLEIEVDVNEAFIGRVFTQQRVSAKLDAYPDWAIPASVIAIIPTADRAKATVRVRIKIDSNDPRVLPDMGVKVAFLKN